MTRFIDRETFLHAPGREKYFKDRWGFTSRVIEKIEAMGEVGRVLEVGPGPTGRPIVLGADTLDNCAAFHPTILHDAGRVPWPVGDKAYDLVVALEAFEHFSGRQRDAFGEVRRVARRAIITVPYKCRTEHHRIGWKEYGEWFGVKEGDGMLVDRGPCKKYMFVFNF